MVPFEFRFGMRVKYRVERAEFSRELKIARFDTFLRGLAIYLDQLAMRKPS